MTDIQQDKELRDLLDVLEGPPGWLADMERILSARDKELERKATITGKLQAAADIVAQLGDEFTKRSLSTDTLPGGYRKMTDGELIAKVGIEYSMPLMRELEELSS